MCLPAPPDPVAPPSNVPSMAAASALDTGGAPRGAALLGRLKLRLDGSGAAPTATTQKTSVPLSQSAGFQSGSPQASSGSPYAYALSANPDLRLPLAG